MWQSILDRIVAECSKDFRKNLGWLFTERYFYRAVGQQMLQEDWNIPVGYGRHSIRVAAEYPLPPKNDFPKRRRGRPENVDVVVLFTKHAARRPVRSRQSSVCEQWLAVVEVKWMSGKKRPSSKQIVHDLARLDWLFGPDTHHWCKNLQYGAFIIAGFVDDLSLPPDCKAVFAYEKVDADKRFGAKAVVFGRPVNANPPAQCTTPAAPFQVE